MKHRVLAFLAHPDDAEMLCAGTLAQLAHRGCEIHIATATAGDCGTVTQSARQITAVRTAEAQKSAELIGATYHCLGLLDGLVTLETFAIRKCIDLFRQLAPTLVFTHPRHDYMLDHEQTHLLARSASFIFAAPNSSQVRLRPGSAVPHLYYCDPIGGVDPLGRPAEYTTIVDVASTQSTKLAMLACHVSQREWLRAHHGMDEYIDATRRRDQERGALIGSAAAEAYIQHRGHAYPSNDLIKELLDCARA